jgi:hypothetical protein
MKGSDQDCFHAKVKVGQVQVLFAAVRFRIIYLLSHLLTKNMKIVMYRIVTFLAGLYSSKAWSVTLTFNILLTKEPCFDLSAHFCAF